MCSYLHFRELEHIFVPACLSVRKIHFSHFCDFRNCRSVISPKICPCIHPIFLLYQLQGHIRYRGIVLNKVHIVQCGIKICNIWTILESFKICNFMWEETFGEKNTQGVTHLWMCGRFSTVVWGICCKTLCGDL